MHTYIHIHTIILRKIKRNDSVNMVIQVRTKVFFDKTYLVTESLRLPKDILLKSLQIYIYIFCIAVYITCMQRLVCVYIFSVYTVSPWCLLCHRSDVCVGTVTYINCVTMAMKNGDMATQIFLTGSLRYQIFMLVWSAETHTYVMNIRRIFSVHSCQNLRWKFM